MEEKKIYLKYIGTGAAIIGVPARDLTKDEADVARVLGHDLLASGIYKLAEPEATANEIPPHTTNTEYQASEDKSKKRGK